MKILFLLLIVSLLLTSCVPMTVCDVLKSGGYVIQTSDATVDVFTKDNALFKSNVQTIEIIKGCVK